MKQRRGSRARLGLAALVMGLALAPAAAWCEPAGLGGLLSGSLPGAQAAPGGNTTAAYEENRPLRDFEIHFLVSLPFTAFYSYLATVSIDSAVKGRFPAEFRQADAWLAVGFAVGLSLAVALGSAGHVPDQSQPQPSAPLDPPQPSSGQSSGLGKMELVRIAY